MPPLWNDVKKALKKKKLEVVGPSKSEAEVYNGAFDADFYRSQVGMPEISDSHALRHYLTEGWKAGLDPSATFSTKEYLAANPDVGAAEVDPLTHYVKFGRAEMRPIERAQVHLAKIDHIKLDSIKGWSVNKVHWGAVFDVRILIDGHLFSTVKNDKPRADLKKRGLAPGNCGIQEDLPLRQLDPGMHTLALEMPDGTRTEKAFEVPAPSDGTPKYPRDMQNDLTLKVVVPIYNAAQDTEVCIQRLIAHTPKEVEIILIDDCSPDPKIQEILKTVSDNPQFRVLSNAENLGFTKTVNRGLKEAGDADVIILNSDARVTPRWSDGLRTAAYARPRIATVTAMSDRAGAFSAPDIGNDNNLPHGVHESDFARAFRRRSLRLYPEVPTGNGFCMYIRRAALDAIGTLDEVAFPRGYGEENDFCMRALRAGWRNIIDDATYVFHDRSKSFGEAKSDHMTAGRKVIDERYPEYKILIRRFHSSNQIKLARYRARLALADCSRGKLTLKRAVFVTATQTGGTPQTNADLMGALGDAFETWVLRCSSRIIELSRYKDGELTLIKGHTLAEAIEPGTHRSREYDEVVADWLFSLDADVVHIRHLAWHSLTLPELAKRSGARVLYSMHDFYTLCPSLKLLDESNVFCGGTCTATAGTCRVALWKPDSIPPLKNAWVHHWRDMMAQAIAPCDGFITTSDSARARALEHLPSIPEDKFHVIPHGRDFPRLEQLQNVANLQDTIRILVPGNIDEAKGLNIILEVLKLDTLGIFEFHILGNVKYSLVSHDPRGLVMHGTYKRENLADKVRDIAPHFSAVLSIWDETFCHTLTEMWSVGVPAVVLDFPTLRKRVEDSGAGWVLEDMSPKAVHAALTKIAADPDDLNAKGAAALVWQLHDGVGQTTRQMAARYMDVYRLPAKTDPPRPNVAVVVPSSRSLNFANPSSEIRVWERTRNGLERSVNYIRMDTSGLLANLKMGTISGAIIQRTAVPTRVIEQLTETANEKGIPYIYEIDDNLLEVPSDKDRDGFYKSYAPFLTQLIRNAAAVTVATDSLAEKMRRHNDHVEVVPNRISSRLWGGVQPPKTGQYPQLLYMGTATHDADLELIMPAIEAASKKFVRLRLNLIGVTSKMNLPDWVNVISVDQQYQSYSNFVPWLRQQVGDIDLGLAPLVEGDFNSCKSGLKVLDYAALGLPMLASQVPAYQTLLGRTPPNGITLLPNTVEAWTQAIVTQLRRGDDLVQEGQGLRSWAFEEHALEPTLNDYDAFVRRVVMPNA